MIPYQDIAAAEQIRTPLAPEMVQALSLWCELYHDRAPWKEPGKVKSLNLPAMAASEVARQVVLEMEATIDAGGEDAEGRPTANARSEYLEGEFEGLLDVLRQKLELTPQQRTEQVYSLYGRALDDGFISKSAAQQAQEAAIESAKADWEKGQTVPDPKESDDYKAMQQARTGKDYEGVKPKFFEAVYGMVDRGEGAKPLAEQLAGIKERFEEYFTEKPADPAPGNPKPAPTVVLPTGGNPAPGAKLTLAEAMKRANAGEKIDVGMIGK